MAVVLKDFICKVTRQLHRAGEEYEGKRAAELQQLGYIGEAGSGDTGGEEWPKHVGGGHYELSNGEKIKGKEAAIEAQAEIDEPVDE